MTGTSTTGAVTSARPGSRRRTTRPATLLVAALLGVLGLTACDPSQVGAAAVIGGDRVDIGTLQDQTRSYLAQVPSAQSGDVQRALLQRIIVSRVIDDAAEDAGVRVPDSQVAEQRRSLYASLRQQARSQDLSPRDFLVRQLASGQQPTVVAPGQVDRWIRDQLVVGQISQQAAQGLDPASPEAVGAANQVLIRAARRLDVEVNPRYGTWDPRSGIAPLVSGGLSRPASELAGEGGAGR
jgi:hypothetical protein